MKRKNLLILITVMSLTLAGCGASNTEAETVDAPVIEEETTEDWMSAVNDFSDGWSNDGGTREFEFFAGILDQLVVDKSNGEQVYEQLKYFKDLSPSLGYLVNGSSGSSTPAQQPQEQSPSSNTEHLQEQAPAPEPSQPESSSGTPAPGSGSMDSYFTDPEHQHYIDPNSNRGNPEGIVIQ